MANFKADINLRVEKFNEWLNTFQGEGGVKKVSESYERFGLHKQANGDIIYTEWAPAAQSMSIFGDFNNWNRD